jgi:hypothetical protein
VAGDHRPRRTAVGHHIILHDGEIEQTNQRRQEVGDTWAGSVVLTKRLARDSGNPHVYHGVRERSSEIPVRFSQ